ncbi:hypothetical protein [Massilia sp. 9096]|uniref:hypothetical protein n=1 Tax=Massilia sp. 9096 TaxID=1500894 RepID=UPI0012E0AAB4
MCARFGNDSGADTTFVYNGFGELVSETSNANSASNMLSYQYDLNGNRMLVHTNNLSGQPSA